MTPEFEDLVGADLPAEERERLRRAHDLLVAAGPLPELPPELEHRVEPAPVEVVSIFMKRRVAVVGILAAALAALAFGGGFLLGHSNHGGFAAAFTVRMHGTSAAPSALGSIQIGKHDADGNWPMVVKVSSLAKLPSHAYYTLWLTKQGKPVAPCGTFRAHGARTSVTFTVAYTLKRFDGWVVTLQNPGHHEPGPVVLTT
jgi:hypothetical protein